MRHPPSLTTRIAVPLIAACLPLIVQARMPASMTGAESGVVQLQGIPSLLGYPSTKAAARPAASNNSAGDTATLFWTTDQAIRDPAKRNDVEAAFASHLPVLVVRGEMREEDTKYITGVFGAASDALITLYIRDALGIRAVALDALPEDDEEAQATLAVFMREVQGKLKEVRAPDAVAPSALRRSRTAGNVNPQQTPDDQVALGKMVLNLSSVGPKGNLVSLETELVRNVTATSQNLRVINKTKHSLLPDTVGSFDGLTFPGASIRLGREVPYRYDVMHQLHSWNAPGGQGYIRPVLVDWAPVSRSSTTFDISETKTTTTSYGISVSPEVSVAKAEQGGVAPSAKLGASFNFGRTYTKENRLAYSVEDYFLKYSAPNMGFNEWLSNTPQNGELKFLTAMWTHQLANSLVDDKRLIHAKNLTPSMLSLAPEAISVWDVPERATGMLTFWAGSRIINRNITSRSPSTVPRFTRPYAQTLAKWSVDPNSPYLTREITVQLRSKAGNGVCLVDAGTPGQPLKTASCDRAPIETDLYAQWQLDNFNRYYNRGSKRCLTMAVPGSSGVRALTTQSCTRNNDQVWQWRADRLHSLHDGGSRDLRVSLNAKGEAVIIGAGAPGFVEYPSNSEDVLFRPWSSYPAAPSKGDFIPTVSVARVPIPDAWLKLPAVPATQSWEVVVIRRPSGG